MTNEHKHANKLLITNDQKHDFFAVENLEKSNFYNKYIGSVFVIP